MPSPLLLDLTHTSHTRSRTGVQRVARSLWKVLGPQARPICHDPYLGAWRTLKRWEVANLEDDRPAGRRGARWPLAARALGALRRRLGPRSGGSDFAAGAEGILVPEIFSPAVARSFDGLFAAVAGPRAAVFHDAIALQLPELTPSKTVARFPAYLRELLAFDGIAAISEDSRRSLLEYWGWLGVSDPPPVVAIPLGIDPPKGARASRPCLPAVAGGTPVPPSPNPLPTLLCVGSIEGRKNHVALLEACERLWAGGLRFELRLLGLSHPQTGKRALDRIAELRRAGRPVRYEGPAPEAALSQAYRECLFTVYPSLREGFGLPVLESLARGRPCVCSAAGALGEAARSGGCLALETMDADSLAGAIRRLLLDEALRKRLEAEASARALRTWPEYVRDLCAWMSGLPRRSGTPSGRIFPIPLPKPLS